LMDGYWSKIPFFQTHPRDIYPSMGLGYRQDWPKSIRATHVGIFAASGSYQTNSALDSVAAWTPVAVAYGLEIESIPYSTVTGERAARLAGDFAITAHGQQAGFTSVGYHSNFFGRYSGYLQRGTYSTFYGNSSGMNQRGNKNNLFGYESGAKLLGDENVAVGHWSLKGAAAGASTTIGFYSGKNAVGSKFTFVGHRTGQYAFGDGLTAIGHDARVGEKLPGSAVTVDGAAIDVPLSRIRLPGGTAAANSWMDDQIIRLDYDSSGLERAPLHYKNSDTSVFRVVVDGSGEFLSTTDSNGVDITSRMFWGASGSNDKNPPNNNVPASWSTGQGYTVRDVPNDITASVVSHGDGVYLCIEAHTSSSVSEPGSGGSWQDYWVRTDPGGPIVLTPYRMVNASTAIGRSASAIFDNSTAIGAGAATNATNQISLGNSSVDQLRLGGVKLLGKRGTGWSMPTGTASRAAFDTSSVTVEELAQRVLALLQDLNSASGHGLIGP
jgi:hypothetical protein